MYCTGSTECLSCTPGNHSIFCLITSKFIYFQREARCSEHQRDCIVLLGCPLFSRCPNFLDFYSFFFRCLDFIDVFSYPGFPDVLVFLMSKFLCYQDVQMSWYLDIYGTHVLQTSWRTLFMSPRRQTSQTLVSLGCPLDDSDTCITRMSPRWLRHLYANFLQDIIRMSWEGSIHQHL